MLLVNSNIAAFKYCAVFHLLLKSLFALCTSYKYIDLSVALHEIYLQHGELVIYSALGK